MAQRDTGTTDQGVMQFNPATGRYDIPAGKSPDTLHQYQVVTAGDGSLFRIDPSNPTSAQPITGPDGKQLTGKQDTKYVQLEGKDGKPHTWELDGAGNPKRDLGPTGEKPANVSVNSGSWNLAEDNNGKPVLFNSKTGESKPAPSGLQKSGTFAKNQAASQKETEPVNAAMGFANDYLQSGVFTGPKDEALLEKYFELAKPSTGFRMTQQQMDMLKNSRSWANSARAMAGRASGGTWFSPEQRQQIVDTMNDLGRAKLASVQAGTSPSINTQRRSTQTGAGQQPTHYLMLRNGQRIPARVSADGKGWVNAQTGKPIL